MFSYTVICEFDDESVAQEWVDWLRDEHLWDVCKAGAIDAEVIAVDRDDDHALRNVWIREVRYHFHDRSAFEIYVRDHAPRLREEGLKRFPPQRGLRYARRSGEIVAEHKTTC